MAKPEIPGYQLRDLLARDDLVQTWRGHHDAGREVLLKCFTSDSPEAVVAFTSRALSCSRLRHANVAALRERGRAGELLFAVRDWFGSDSLRTVMPSLAPLEAVRVALHLGRGLEHAHLHGLVHGAIKPENVLFITREQPVLVDFALLRSPSRGELVPPDQESSVVHDPRVDQFALAKLTHQMLSVASAKQPQAALHDPQLLAALERACSPEPDRRFRRLEELVSEIDAALMRAQRAPSGPSKVEVKLVDRTLRVSVTGTWTPQAVETCSRDIGAAMQGKSALAIGYVLHAEGGCHSAAIDTIAELHRRHRTRLRRVGFVSDTPQARGASVLIGTRVAGLDWKTFASVDGMEAWLREGAG